MSNIGHLSGGVKDLCPSEEHEDEEGQVCAAAHDDAEHNYEDHHARLEEQYVDYEPPEEDYPYAPAAVHAQVQHQPAIVPILGSSPAVGPILGASPAAVPVSAAEPSQVPILGTSQAVVPILGAEPNEARANDEMGSEARGDADEQGASGEHHWLLAPEQGTPDPRLRTALHNAVREGVNQATNLTHLSHVGSADVIIAALGGRERLVSGRGELRWLGDSRCWRLLDDATLEDVVASLDPSRRVPGGAAKGINLRAGDISGIAKKVRSGVSQPNFFPRGSHGVVFANSVALPVGKKVRFKPLTADHRVRAEHVLNFDFMPDARDFIDQSEFVLLIRRMFDDDPEREMIVWAFLALLGAGMLGIAPRYAKAFLLVGALDSGRIALIEAIQAVLPAGASSAIPFHDFGQRFVTFPLATALVNATAEIPVERLRESTAAEVIKTVMGQKVYAENKHTDRFGYTCGAAHIAGCRDLPDMENEGLRSVFEIFNCRATIPHDPLLVDRIKREARLVTSLAILAAQDLIADGHYDRPASCEEENWHWTQARDPVASWLTSRLTATASPQEGFLGTREITAALNAAGSDTHKDGWKEVTDTAVGIKLGNLEFLRPPSKKHKGVHGFLARWTGLPG